MPGRLLRLLSLLQTPARVVRRELAERLGVTERTIRRDVERLRALDYPVTGTTGTAGGYRLGSGTTLPPLLLDDDEAIAVALGLVSAGSGGLTGIADSSMSALAKLHAGAARPSAASAGGCGFGGGHSAARDSPGRSGCAGHAGPLLPQPRDRRLRLREPAGRVVAAPGRTAPARHGLVAVVPARLRPGPRRLAVLPGRPDLGRQSGAAPVRAAITAGGRRRVVPGRVVRGGAVPASGTAHRATAGG